MTRVPAYEGRNNYMFVSYAHKDSELVLPIITKLYEEKYRVWYDEGIVPGSEWPHNIETHLKACSTALIYISKNSLASLNCENEVVNALQYKKRIIQYSLDGSIHPLIQEKAISSEEELMNVVTDDLIGDGTGYDIDLNNRHRFSIWNVLLGLSVILFVVLIAGVYGLNKGYFDEYLPGKNTTEEEIIETRPQEGVQIDNDLFAQAILEQLGQEDLFKLLEFEDEEDRKTFYDAAGLWGYKIDGELNYYDLTNLTLEEIKLEGCSDECLKLLKYLPELKTLTIDSDRVSDLEPLASCAKLETVYVTKNCFPLTIPEEKRFELQYTK